MISIFWLIPDGLHAQETIVDSIRMEYEKAPNDSLRILQGIQLVRQLSRTDALEAVKFGKALQKDLEEMIETEALPKQVLLEMKWQFLSYLATSYHMLGDVEEEISLLLTVLEEARKEGNRQRERSSLANIGVSYHKQGHVEEALRYYRMALKIAQEEGSVYGIAMAYGNLGTLIGTSNSDSTLYYYRQSLHYMLMDEMTDQGGALGWMYNNLGSWHEGEGNTDSAFYYYNLSMQIRDSIDHRLGMTMIRSELADLLFSQGRYEEALQKADQSVNILEAGHFETYVYNIYSLRSKILEAKGDYKKALDDYKTFKFYSDSLRSDRNTKNLVQQTMRYDYSKQLLADSLDFAKKEAIKDLEIARRDANLLTQRIALMATSGGLILLVLLAASIRRGKKRSDELLLNILPYEVAEELKKKGEAEARLIDNATIMLTDFKDFTSLSEKLTPKELVVDIHAAFTGFDKIMEKHGLEKIKTIGDAYMAAGGLPIPSETHALDVVRAALDIRDFIQRGKQKKIDQGLPYFEIRIGIHTGPVVAGIVGIKKFSYDIWGDTVNTAARLESSGKEGHVNISDETYKLLKDNDEFEFALRGQIETKGKGMIKMWFVDWKR